MAFSMCAFYSATLSLLVVSANAAAAIQQTRQGGLRYQKVVGRQPDADEQEALTREDMLQQQNAVHSLAEGVVLPPPAMPQQMPQLSQLQQMQQMQQMQMQQMQQTGQLATPPMQAQQLLQAQAVQMRQMQQQLQQQQQELQRLQQQSQHPAPPQHQQAPAKPQPKPRVQQKRAPAAKRPVTHAAKKSLVGVNTQVMTKSEMESGSGGSGISKPKGWDQCLKFARFVKTQDVTGLELVRVWKSTCEPAVQSGRATERYKLMCNSLSGVIEPYAAQIDYDVEQLCDSVLAVFHDVTAVDAKAR